MACSTACTGSTGRVGTWDGYTGWVPGRAIPGYYPPAEHAAKPRRQPGSTATGPPQGWAGGRRGAHWVRRRDGFLTTLALPGPAPCGRCQEPSECRLTANRARFQVISWKVSQNGQVSPRNVQKACHSPYSQNEAQKSPLEILRFLFLLAFSHKELMGLF